MALPSLLGLPITDEIVDILKIYIKKYINMPYIEIEGKLGLIKLSRSRDRIDIINTKNITLLGNINETYFDSEIPQNIFYKINQLLQTRKSTTNNIISKYERIFECDKFYTYNNEKVRVSYDENDKVK